jgi:hypothetical protein
MDEGCMFINENYNWVSYKEIKNKSFICGFCNNQVSSNRGYSLVKGPTSYGGAYICPNCQCLTLIFNSEQFPVSALGNSVQNVPEDLNTLYEEARKCTSQACYTAAVLSCRKILMNIAVDKGAEKNKAFIKYVDYLSDKGYVPPDGKHWVDHIRQKGNEANHEIELMTKEDAKDLLIFIEMLLKINYEFPNMIPRSDKNNV